MCLGKLIPKPKIVQAEAPPSIIDATDAVQAEERRRSRQSGNIGNFLSGPRGVLSAPSIGKKTLTGQ